MLAVSFTLTTARDLAYLVAIAGFIFALKGLSSPRHARLGNLVGAAAATLAIGMTFTLPSLRHSGWNLVLALIAMVLGAAVAVPVARFVKMTAMPQLVAIFNGVGGGAAALISIVELLHLHSLGLQPAVYVTAEVLLGVLIGSVSFAGSAIAFIKLQELITGRPITYPGQQVINALVGVAIAVMVILALVTGSIVYVWVILAPPRLISTSNFSEKQVTPYTLTWQVSENGTILSTQTSDYLGVITCPGSGVYTIELTVTDANGDTASSSDTVTVNPVTATATLIGHNTTTQGTWIGTYGSQGYDVVGNTASLPSYATVTPSGESTLTWAVSTTNESTLENAGDITGRVAAAWSSATSFSVDVNLTDGNAHDLALYAVDFDNQGISEQIQISAAATGTVLDSESISSFSGGIYLDWRVLGNVLITVTSTSGPAVLSGLFLDAPPVTATLVRQDATTNGDWIGTYGSQGYDVIGTPASIPSYATITLTNQTTDMDDTSAIANAALEQPSGGGRYVGDWSSTSQFSVLVNLTDGQPYDLTLYAVDWADDGRTSSFRLQTPPPVACSA